LFSLEKRRLIGNLISQQISGRMLSAFSQVKSARTQGNGLTLYQERFRVDIRKNFFTEKLDKHWNGLSREVAEPPSLEVFETRGCVTKGHGLMKGLSRPAPLLSHPQSKKAYQTPVTHDLTPIFFSCIS